MLNAENYRMMMEEMSIEEISEIRNLTDKILEERASQKYNSLVNQITTAFKQLHEQFPSSEIWVDVDGAEVDLMNYDIDESCFHQ